MTAAALAVLGGLLASVLIAALPASGRPGRPPRPGPLRWPRRSRWLGRRRRQRPNRSPRLTPAAGAGLPATRPLPGPRIVMTVAAAVTAVVLVMLAPPEPRVVLLLSSGGALFFRGVGQRRAAARRRGERAAAAPAVIDLLGACLLAGLNPYRSLQRVAARSPDALRAELSRASADLDSGRTPGAALRAVAERTGLDELRAAAAALEAAERWGAPPAEALAARAEALRSRARLRAEGDAGRAAVRLAFPLVFCFLPAFALLVVVPTMAGALRALAP